MEDTTVYKLQADQIEFLRRELERKDSIIMSLTQRIPELESPRDGPETGGEDAAKGPGRGDDASEPRGSWWRRIFLGEG